MPSAEYDHVLSCDDCGWEGKPCNLRTFKKGREVCTFDGWDDDTALPIPENKLCNKTPKMAQSGRLSLLARGISPEDRAELTGSYEYHEWLKAYNHYAKPTEDRLKEELVLLRRYVAFRRYIGWTTKSFNRRFSKFYKPRGVGLKPTHNPSFRMRVLANDPVFLAGENPEYVALCPVYSSTAYVDEIGPWEESYWDLGILSKGTQFQYEVEQAGVETFEEAGLLEILKEHQGHKILIKWSWSTSFDYEGECDMWIEKLEFVRRL